MCLAIRQILFQIQRNASSFSWLPRSSWWSRPPASSGTSRSTAGCATGSEDFRVAAPEFPNRPNLNCPRRAFVGRFEAGFSSSAWVWNERLIHHQNHLHQVETVAATNCWTSPISRIARFQSLGKKKICKALFKSEGKIFSLCVANFARNCFGLYNNWLYDAMTFNFLSIIMLVIIENSFRSISLTQHYLLADPLCEKI